MDGWAGSAKLVVPSSDRLVWNGKQTRQQSSTEAACGCRTSPLCRATRCTAKRLDVHRALQAEHLPSYRSMYTCPLLASQPRRQSPPKAPTGPLRKGCCRTPPTFSSPPVLAQQCVAAPAPRHRPSAIRNLSFFYQIERNIPDMAYRRLCLTSAKESHQTTASGRGRGRGRGRACSKRTRVLEASA